MAASARGLGFHSRAESFSAIAKCHSDSRGESVDSGLIPSRVKPMTFKLVFTASLLDARRKSVENLPASLLVPLGKDI